MKDVHLSSNAFAKNRVNFMAIITFIFISLLIFIHPALSDQINQACKATRYQKLCESSLTSRPKGNVMEIIKSAISVSSDKLHAAQPMAQSILKASAGNLKNDAKKCIEQLRISDYRLKSTTGALAGRKMKDARAWTSDGLGNQYESLSALKKMKDTKLITDMKSLLTTLINCTSNALSMMLACDLYGEKTASWSPPKTERDGVWERHGLVGKEPQLGVPAGLKADVTVCKGGGCKYATVQQAVNASPNWGKGRRFVILIKAGVYKETVQVGHEKQNIVFLGDGLGKTVISGALSVGKNGISTYFTATVGVLGDGFMAKGLTFENTAGSDAHQAVAFRSSSDKSILENCEFLGHQDTLYALSLRQFYKSCRIHGNVDFIFGNAAAIFQDCTILIRPRQSNPEKGEDNAVTAHSRNDPAQSTGFVFRNCLVNGTEEYMKSFKSNPKVHKNFLGRPWKEFARTVFIGCKLEALITPQGWMPWTGDVGLKTLYYGEFGNTGKGSVLTGRVAWSSRIPANHVNMYSIVNFLQGDQWKLT